MRPSAIPMVRSAQREIAVSIRLTVPLHGRTGGPPGVGVKHAIEQATPPASKRSADESCSRTEGYSFCLRSLS
jgi:hypothetical protein